MKVAYFRKSLKLSISRTFVSLLLVIPLVACGAKASTRSSSAQPHPSRTANTPVNTTPSLNLNASNITVDVGDLRVQSAFGFQCPGTGSASVSESLIFDQLVLASSRTTYSQDEIAQMQAYVSSGVGPISVLTRGIKPPPTLRWVLGGSVDPIPGAFDPGLDKTSPFEYGDNSPCGASLHLTNRGYTPIQIPKVGVQLEARPQQNSYQYHLIDLCSVVPPSHELNGYCGPQIGGVEVCHEYYAVIQLGLGEKGSVFSSVPVVPSGPECGTLTIAPASDVILDFQFNLTSSTPENLIYSILPILTVHTAQGEQTLSLSQLVSTLAFASTSQFSCYQLQGTTFVLVPSPVWTGYLWCM